MRKILVRWYALANRFGIRAKITSMKPIESRLQSIVNPSTGRTLAEEDRWQNIAEHNNHIIITYKSTGTSFADKKKIEQDILQAIKDIKASELVLVRPLGEEASTSSGQSIGKERPSEAGQKAELRAEHGKINAPKPIVGVKKIIAISSCKGGVGKSTVAVNLAFALKNSGARVGILDADIYGPSIPMLLGERNSVPTASSEKKIKPIESRGISFISFGLFVKEQDAVVWRGPMLGGVLNQFLFDTDWGVLDYLLLDLPPGTGDVQLSLAQNTKIDCAIIVTTPQNLAILDTRKGVEMFRKVKVPVAGLVENMSYFVPEDDTKKYYLFGEGGGAKLACDLDIPLLAEIPLEIPLCTSADKGVPYMSNYDYKDRPIWNAYMKIASSIDNEDKPRKILGTFSRLFKK